MVNGIGIYIEYDNNDKKWNKSIEEKLQRQLDGFQIEIDESKVKQKLIFKNYSLLDINSLRGGAVVPGSSIYKNGLFVELELKVAFKANKDNMIFWAHKDSWLSLPFILQFLLKQRNLTFVHAAGVTIENKGILLLGFGGIGKTALIPEVAKDERIKILGDDFVLLENKGYLHPYHRPFCLYPYHRNLFPEYFKKHKVRYKELTLWNRGIRKLKSILKLPDNNTYGYKTVAPSQLFDKNKIVDKRVPIDRVYLLRRYKGLKNIKCSKIYEIDRVVNFCTGVMFHDWYSLAKMTFNRLAQREESVSEYYKFFEDNIRKCISRATNIYVVDIPENMGAIEVAKELSSIILKKENI